MIGKESLQLVKRSVQHSAFGIPPPDALAPVRKPARSE
jgi:hypothetical protein